MKIRPIEAKLFHADRRKDTLTDKHDAANSRFSQICARAQNIVRILWAYISGIYLQVSMDELIAL